MNSNSCWLTVGIVAILVTSCSVARVKPSPSLPAQARWVVLPVQNHSETPMAGERVESMLWTLLRSRGIDKLESSQVATAGDDDLIAQVDDGYRLAKAIQWAQSKEYAYGVTGSVEEWRYKNGPDSDPVVGVSLRVIDLKNNHTIWSASAAKTGWGRASTSGTALAVLETLVDGLTVQP